MSSALMSLANVWENGVDHDPALTGVATDSHNKGTTSCARLRRASFYQTRGPSTRLARDPVGHARSFAVCGSVMRCRRP